MYLIVQIPCYNEENTLPLVIKSIPDSIEGIDKIEIQIIDDGSNDSTVAIAQSLGVDHIIKNIGNKGLGNSFQIGMNHAISLNADILVNTDGDNQYPSKYILNLVEPIINNQADIVIGNRQTRYIKHFSPIKRFLQWLGTKVTIILSGEKNVKDAVSGFRAYSRHALLQLNVTSSFSYVLDTTLQASQKKIKTVSIPIITNKPTRPSRLFDNIWQHIYKSTKDLFRVYALYRPLRVFVSSGILLFLLGIIPIIIFLIDYFFISGGTGKVQSLIIGSTLISISFNLIALGIIGDLIGKNRNLIEQILVKTKSN